MKRRAIAIGLVALLLGGCYQSRVAVTTESFRHPNEGVNFEGDVAFAVQEEGDLFHREVGYKIERVLRARGCRVVPEHQADYVIGFDLGVEPKVVRETSYEWHAPETVEKSTTRKVTKGHKGKIHCDNEWTETTTEVPGGFERVEKEQLYHDRWINLFVMKGAKRVWEGRSYSVGESDDLREVVNYLLAANFKHFGERVHRVKDSFTKKDAEIQAIKNVM